MKLLDYVAIYGLVLMPIGAIVFAEHWVFPLLGIERYQTEKYKKPFNGNALLVWMGTLLVCAILPMHLYFRWLPGYFLALFAYIFLNLIRKGDKAEPTEKEEHKG
jgi:cytosine/uracil/thiamine/allantoin permease